MRREFLHRERVAVPWHFIPKNVAHFTWLIIYFFHVFFCVVSAFRLHFFLFLWLAFSMSFVHCILYYLANLNQLLLLSNLLFVVFSPVDRCRLVSILFFCGFAVTTSNRRFEVRMCCNKFLWQTTQSPFSNVICRVMCLPIGPCDSMWVEFHRNKNFQHARDE